MTWVFCLRPCGRFFEGITNSMCVSWLAAMFPTNAPVPGVWTQVPNNLLPEGAAVAYFNANAFMEQVVAPNFATEKPTPRFSIGQLVKLDATGFGEGARLQHGDLGRILSDGEMNEFDNIAYSIHWLRADFISSMCEERLEFHADADEESDAIDEI